MNLFESINNSLNNTVKSLSEEYLTEKKQKQEISPEDEHDNEIIRNIINKIKRPNRHYFSDEYNGLSEEEEEILKKYDIDRCDDTLYTNLGSFDATENAIEHDRVSKGRGGINSTESDPNKIDFVNMSRKQKERSKYYKDYFETPGIMQLSIPKVYRGTKKNNDYDRSHNTQNIERKIENIKLKHTNTPLKRMKSDQARFRRQAEDEYTRADNKRSQILSEIQRLKNLLSNLDTEAEENANGYVENAKRLSDEIDTYMNDKRAKLQALKDRKRQKNESLLLEKRYIPTPEDERDDELLRSIISKLDIGEEDTITDEERDAAERNGYEIDDYNYRLIPKYGWITRREVYNPVHSTNSDSTRVVDKVVRMRDKEGNTIRDEEGNPKRTTIPANVNLADLGRKRQERINKFPDYIDSFDTRRNRKKKYKTYGGDISYDSINFENRVRKSQNKSLSNEHNIAKNNSDLKRREYRDIERAYNRGDERREEILKRIASLKKELMDLDNNTNTIVNDHISNAKYYETKLKDMIDAKKKNIEEIRKKKRGERKNVNK